MSEARVSKHWSAARDLTEICDSEVPVMHARRLDAIL